MWPRTDDVLVDVDPPASAEPVRTVVVLTWLDEGFHGDVEEIMEQQLRYTWMLCDPDPKHLVDDRRVRRHAPLLMALTDELDEAFPDRGRRRSRESETTVVPDYYEEFIGKLRGHETAPTAIGITTKAAVVLLARTLWGLARGRKLTFIHVGESLKPVQEQPVTGDEHEAGGGLQGAVATSA